jgi:DNA-binding MarR family transcriptional regulator
MIAADIATVLDCYPRVFFACHRAHVRDTRSGHTLSSRQSGVLDHLDPVEPTHLHVLAAHLGITPSSMSIMIDRLERGGYVRRSRDKADARRVNLRLTSSGLRIKQQQKVLDSDLVESLLRRLTPPQRESALAGLTILARAADELVASRNPSRFQKEKTA